jgi:hypothetical protein
VKIARGEPEWRYNSEVLFFNNRDEGNMAPKLRLDYLGLLILYLAAGRMGTIGGRRRRTPTYSIYYQTPSHMWSLRLSEYELTPTNKFLPGYNISACGAIFLVNYYHDGPFSSMLFFSRGSTGLELRRVVASRRDSVHPQTHVSEPFSVAHLPRTFFIPCADAIHFVSVE